MRVQTWLLLAFFFFTCSGCGKKQKSTAELIADLNGPQDRERVIAARLLPQRKGDTAQVVPALIEALKDKEPDVRWSAAIGLGSFGDQAKEAIPALQALKNDPDSRVREGARNAVARIDPDLAAKATENSRAQR